MKRVVSQSLGKSPASTEPEPRAAWCGSVANRCGRPSTRFRGTQRVGSGEKKELFDFNICLGIEEVREHEETCSFGNPGSLQMATSTQTCLKTWLCPLSWFLTKLVKCTQLLDLCKDLCRMNADFCQSWMFACLLAKVLNNMCHLEKRR